MSVYKEGYYAIKLITNNSKRIFDDAADYGCPVKKGDGIWMWVKQLVEWYRVRDVNTRVVTKYPTGTTVSEEVELIDEWNCGNEERFKVTYTTTRGNDIMDGIVEVERLR